MTIKQKNKSRSSGCPRLVPVWSLSPSPARGFIGTDIPVTIQGDGLSGATVNAGPGISVTVNGSNGAQIQATFSISSTAPAGYHTVTVTAHGQTSNSANFYVQVPSHFVRFDQPPEAPGGVGPVIAVTNGNIINLNGQVIATHACGVYQNYIFELVDQDFVSILNGIVTVQEVFSNISTGSGPDPSINTINLASQGETDIQAYAHTYPTCLASNENQSLDMTWTVQVVSSGVVYPLATVVHISKGNFNGTLNVTSSISVP